MAEQCGERDVMITIKRFIRQKSKPIGKQYYLVLDNFKHDGNNVWIYEEDLLAMLKRLIRAMDEPIMEDVDYSDVYEVSEQLRKKCKKKKNTGNPLDGLIDYVKGGKSTPNQIETEEEADKSTEELLQELARIEEERIQKEKEKEEKRCKARDDWFQAERELAEEKAKYSKAKRIEQIFNGKVQPMVQPFLKLMESLIYFAGCLNAEDFATRKRVLLNRQRMICSNMQASIWGFPLDREAFAGIEEMLFAMEEEIKLPKAPQLLDSLTVIEYIQKKRETEELKRKYLIENEKLRRNESRQRQILEYISLFQELFPIIEKISNETLNEVDEAWAVSIGLEIVQRVNNYESRNANMKFIFVYPDDDICIQSESVRVDFIAAESDSPGLYYRDNKIGKLICVIPGRVK